MLKSNTNIETIYLAGVQRRRHVYGKCHGRESLMVRGSFTGTERRKCMCGILGLAEIEDSFREALKLKIHRYIVPKLRRT